MHAEIEYTVITPPESLDIKPLIKNMLQLQF